MLPFPHVPKIVEAIHALGLTQSIVSNSSADDITDILRPAEFFKRFTSLIGSDPSRKRKPDPAPYLAALNEMKTGLTPADAMAIEDTETGLLAARAAGIDAVLMTTASNRAFLTEVPHLGRITHESMERALTNWDSQVTDSCPSNGDSQVTDPCPGRAPTKWGQSSD